ncbi:MAG: response regulator [Armatimonadota bacterium]
MDTATRLASYLGGRSPRILAVDDQPVNLELLAEILSGWGCAVRTAINGVEALAAVDAFQPDVILLDVMMPDQSGFEVCELLQADPTTRSIPVIFLTALADEKHKLEGFGVGALDYITKPFDLAELAARVGARLRHKHAEDTLRTRQADLSATLSGEPSGASTAKG